MKRVVIVTAVAVAAAGWLAWLGSPPKEGRLAQRLVYISLGLQTDNDVAEFERVARRASEHGFTGVVLSSVFDRIALQQPAYFDRLSNVAEICKQIGLDLVPQVFSVGHGSALLDHDRHLAAAVPVREALFVASKGRAQRAGAAASVALSNGGFESSTGDHVAGLSVQDRPGVVSFVDRGTRHEGRSSLRFENFVQSTAGMGRIMQQVAVTPFRCYRVSCWVKTDSLYPPQNFRIQVLTTGGRTLMSWSPRVGSTEDWHEVVTGFNSLRHDTVRVYAGIWKGQSGRLWIDDLDVEESGPINVLRRDATPFTVRSEISGAVYEEGRDFVVGDDEPLTFRFDHAGPAIEIPRGSRIGEEERLRVSYYQGLGLDGGQIAVCMSDPKVEDIWRDEVRLIEEHLSPRAYFIACDEIRQGGWCEQCRQRGLSAAGLLGDCVRRQVQMIRRATPDADILVWADMFDPNHNATTDYYLFDGSFHGSWEQLPADLIVACWYFHKRDKSLAHFDSLGFRTIGAAYYDEKTLSTTRRWLETLRRTPDACGIMYTTWRSDYSLLESFGDLVAGDENP